MKKKAVVVIPARINSSRLPRKVLLDLKGKPVIQRVYEQCFQAKTIEKVYIAVDSMELYNACQQFTDNVIISKKIHESGTDRIAEAIVDIDCDIVINVQGDEPFIDQSVIEDLVNQFINDDVTMASVFCKIKSKEDLMNPNIVKVVMDNNNNALYFSRSMIPFVRASHNNLSDDMVQTLNFSQHLGIYGYTKEFLCAFSKMPVSYIENQERLEQLRVLENGYKIKMIESTHYSIGIDTREDYEKAKVYLNDF